LKVPLTVLVGIYSPVAAWNIPAGHLERLRLTFPHHTFVEAADDEQARARILDADVAFMSELRPVHLAAAQQLRWVHSPAAGVGGMLFPAMVASAVVVTNSRGISADTIAEHVLAVTLVMFRKLPLAFRSQAVHEWAQDAILAAPGLRTIAGSHVLIIGPGSIGGATARRMAALGARVTAIRRNMSRTPPEGVETVATPEQLRDLLPQADVVVIAAPQTPDTRGLIGARELDAMRPDALLVNVSRGRLIDEAALVSALTAPEHLRRPGAAALDVFEQEPLPPESPLWSMPNVLITPHMSGFRPDHWDAVIDLFADNLRRFESGQPLRNVVDKEAGY
jgi:phosphoglycerate dehydrogenase-like enzyme